MLRTKRRISASHRDAFLERYQELRSWAVQMTANDQALAEDLLHDLFILFTLNQPDLQRIQNLDNYLFTCLRNLHISQLRRATRGRFEQLSLVEYDSARLGLHSAHGRDWIQVQDELRRICHYANLRKETSNAASVLILRFFHGYYPSEIAKMLGTSRAAVDKRLLAARTEAKAYLENSTSLSFINKGRAAPKPDVFPVKFARTPNDFLFELQEAIFQSRPGECLSSTELKDLYRSDREASVARKHIAHLVSCPVCLDAANTLLGLPLLAERYPTDTMDKDNKKGGGPPDDKSGGEAGSAARKIKDWERETREAFEHKPQELCVSVNGYLLGSQLIGSELSELTLNVTADERINFCEVFSEQGVRLMMMNVDELPPNGPGELRQRVELSEDRTLESALFFSNPFPTLHVTYHDPELATGAVVDDTHVTESSESVAVTPQQKRIRRLRTSVPVKKPDKPSKRFEKPIFELARVLRERLFNAQFWLRPATITAAFALLLLATIFIVTRRHEPAAPIMASDLLQRVANAEQVAAANNSSATHRTLQIETRRDSAHGEVLARQRVEVWQSALKGVTARRLYDEQGRLLAGDWTRSDNVTTLYHHGARPQIQIRNVQSAIRGVNVWRLAPSATDFTTIVGQTQNVRVEERESQYLLTFEGQGVSAPGLVRATLSLNRDDLRAVEQTLLVHEGSELRAYRISETSFERRPNDAVAPGVFEPDAELISHAGTRGKGDAANISASPSLPVSPSLALATPALELEVLQLLNQANAFMGEQVSVSRTNDGRLLVSGLVETEERKAQLQRALVTVRNNPAVHIAISTVAEAAQRERPKSSGNLTMESVEATEGTSPVDGDLRQRFSEEETRRYIDRTLARSRQARRHALALKQLAERFSPVDLRAMSAADRTRWIVLLQQHARECQRELQTLRRELQQVFSSLAGPGGSATGPSNDGEIQAAVRQLYELSVRLDEGVYQSLALSFQRQTSAPVKTQQFWQSLSNAEGLAARMAQAR